MSGLGTRRMACTYLEDGDLAERLHFHESFSFVLSLGHVDIDKLEGDFLLNENSRYTLSAGGGGVAVEFQDHGCDTRVVYWSGRCCSNCFAGAFYHFQEWTIRVSGAYAAEESKNVGTHRM